MLTHKHFLKKCLTVSFYFNVYLFLKSFLEMVEIYEEQLGPPNRSVPEPVIPGREEVRLSDNGDVNQPLRHALDQQALSGSAVVDVRLEEA